MIHKLWKEICSEVQIAMRCSLVQCVALSDIQCISHPEGQPGVGGLVAVELAGVGVQRQNARDEEEQRAQQAVQQILQGSNVHPLYRLK